ncbi:phage tail tip fiber protein [Pseudomonas sp. E2-15]
MLEAKVGENAASILDVARASATATSALAERVTTMGAKVDKNEATFKSETTALADADKALSEKIETVQAVSGENTAAIKQASQAQATTDGKVSAMVTFKAETVVGGKKVASGFSFGSDGEQAEFLIFAQRFAVVDEVSGAVVPMFVVQNNQVFISQAIINKALIQEIIASMSIKSEAVDAQGQPLIDINFVTGQFIVRGQRGNISNTLDNMGMRTYQGATLRFRSGMWEQ